VIDNSTAYLNPHGIPQLTLSHLELIVERNIYNQQTKSSTMADFVPPPGPPPPKVPEGWKALWNDTYKEW